MSFFCFWQKENLKTVMSQFCDDILGIVVAFCETEAFIFDYKFEINSYVVTILTNCGFSENRFIMKPISSFRHFQMLSPQTSLNGDVYAISAGKETHYCIYKFRKEQQFGSFSQTLKFTDLFHPMEFTELFQPIQSFSIYNLEGNSKLFEHCGNVYIYSPNLYSDIIKFFSTNINVDDGNNVRNCTLKKKTHALKYLILIYKTLPVININALNVVRRTLVSCNECLYFTGLEPNLNILIISQLIFDLEKQIVNTEQTFIYQQNPDEKKLLIQVVHPRAKKILYLSENFLCVFDCVKQKWKTPKMHKNKLNIYGYGEQKHQDDLAIIAPLDDNVIYFPFWSCKCKQQPSKCNYYDISLRMWVLCCSMMLSDSPIVNTHDQFLFKKEIIKAEGYIFFRLMSFFCFVEKRFLQLIVPFCDDVINIVLQYDTAPLLLFFDEPDVVSEHMVVKIMGFLAVPIETTRLISYGGLHSRKWSFSEFLHVDNINNLVLTITKQTELCEFNYQNLRFGEKLDCQDYFQPLVSGLLPDSNLF